MKYTIFFGMLSLVVSISCGNLIDPDQVKISEPTIPSIAFLGTFHFGSTTDYSSMKTDNFLSDKRQQEINELVAVLAQYQPTKIMLEYTIKENDKVMECFTNYLSGGYQLKLDEREQLGFRLAKRLGHKKIYCIDYKKPLPFRRLSEFANTYSPDTFEKFLNSIKENDKKDSEYLNDATLLDYYAFKNTEVEDSKNKNQYLVDTAGFISDSSYIGVEFVSKWWERNFHIMANINLKIEPKDRVLVIIGGAHRAVLKDFYKDRNDIEYVEIHTFLK
ncbi:DUF5694 domain-containing protein [uncultured Aquimarina sp.]|uniref:DUF5694 domain-containing protein n=1 Tax=uncultured Aquimarina sp. TaxID=575652 RepID=UPI0026117FD7|nr:DUF5694 domain-containing protein [uncultured Aquimarina sp.]